MALLLSPLAHAKPRPALPLLPERQLASWRFNDADPAPLISLNLQTAESWSGHALEMTGKEARLLALPEVSVAGKTNLSRAAGTLRFWFAPAWSSGSLAASGPGEEARLLEFGAWSSQGAVSRWSLSFDPKGATIRFVAQSHGEVLEILRAPVAWFSGEWHQISLLWSAKETLLYLDGRCAAEGQGIALESLSNFEGATGFCLGSDVHGGRLAQGQFEEFYSLGRVCTDQDLAEDYQRNAPLAALGPVTPAEQQAMLAAAAQAALEKLAAGSGAAQSMMAGADYGCSLWLEIAPANNAVTLTLHNTVPGKTYQILRKESLSLPSWTLEKTVVGTAGQDDTVTTVQMNGRPTLFFIAVEVGEYFVEQSFKGLDVESAVTPPDTMGAIGINHFVELLNGVIAVFDKASGERRELRSIEEFFAIPGTSYPQADMLDPRILYDHQAQRWVACAIDRGSQHVILAISQGSSPLELLTGWTNHLVTVARAGSNSDYVTLGADKNGIYLSVLHHHGFGQQFVNDGHTVVAIKKQEIYQGSFQHQALYNAPSELNTTCIQPALNFDDPPSGGHAWFVAKGAPAVDPSYTPGPIYYRRLQWNGGTAGWADTTWRMLTNPAQTYLDYYDLDSGVYYGLNLGAISAPQAGGTVEIGLSGVGSRLMMAMVRNGFLWTCQQVGLDDTDGDYGGDHTGSTVDRSAAQWLKLQINASGEPLTLNDHGRIFDNCAVDPYYYYFPSLMVNSANDMVVGFSASKETEYIGAFFSWRLANGSTLDRPALIHRGVDYYGNNRWGDYSYTSLDPTDGLTIWTVQQYAEGPSFGGSSVLWGTWIAKIRPYP